MSFRRYRDYQQGEFYVVFADTAVGAGDYCAAQFLCKTKSDVPVVYHSKESATVMTPQLAQELERINDITGVQPVVAYERNNGGAFEMDRLASLNRMGKFRIYTMKQLDGTGNLTDSGKYGYDTNTATRPKMLQDLKEAIEKRLIRIYDKPTINEMFSFIVVQTSSAWKAQAEKNAHDDLVMSLAGAWQLYQSENPPQQHNSFEGLPNDDPFEEVFGGW